MNRETTTSAGVRCSLWNLSRTPPEQVFLAVGIVAGVVSVLLMPPFTGADERAHLFRAYQISEGTLLAERHADRVGGFLPKALQRSSWDPEHKRFNWLNLHDRGFAEFRNTALYAPVPYLPQATAIAVGRIVHLPRIFLLYLGRLAGLAASLTLIFAAIRVAPIGKRLFVLLALTPMALRQMTALTADSVTNAAAFLLVAMFLRLALDRQMQLGGRFLALLALCSLVVSLSKQAYFPLLFLYFMCPAERIGSLQRYLATFLGIAALNLAALAAWFWVIQSLYAPQPIAPDADPARQLAFIVSHPIDYCLILLADARYHWASYLAHCFGYVRRLPPAFGWLHVPVLALVGLVDGREDVALGLRAKSAIIGVLVTTIVVVNTLNYLGWNPVGADSISFIQGRYYIPITPLPALLLSNRRLSSVLPEHHLTLLVGCVAALVAGTGICLVVSPLAGS